MPAHLNYDDPKYADAAAEMLRRQMAQLRKCRSPTQLLVDVAAEDSGAGAFRSCAGPRGPTAKPF